MAGDVERLLHPVRTTATIILWARLLKLNILINQKRINNYERVI